MPAKPFAAPTPVTSDESPCECGAPDGVHLSWCYEANDFDLTDLDFDIDPEIPEEF